MELTTIKTTFTPATLEIEKFEVLEQYVMSECEKIASLVITEENAKSTKKEIIAPLRKQIKALNDAKIKATKEATKQIDEVHKRIKALDNLLETAESNVQSELNRQELERKTEKQAKIDELIAEHGNGKNIIVESDWLNESKKLNEIENNIKNQVFSIEQQEKLRLQQVKQLETVAELLEAKHDVKVDAQAYVSMLDYLELDQIEEKMTQRVNIELEKRETEKQRVQQQKEQEKCVVVEHVKEVVGIDEVVEETKEESKTLFTFTVRMTEEQAMKMKKFIQLEEIEVVK